MRNPLGYITFTNEHEDCIQELREEGETFEDAAQRLYDQYVESWVDLIV